MGVENLQLEFGVSFEDIYTRQGLVKLDSAFLGELKGAKPEAHKLLLTVRSGEHKLLPKEESELLTDIAPFLEDFTAKLFNVEKEVGELRGKHNELADIYTCKRQFVQRRIVKFCKPAEGAKLDGEAIAEKLEAYFGESLSELSYAKNVLKWLDDAEQEDKIILAAQYASWALHSDSGRCKHGNGILFKIPKKLDLYNLVELDEGDFSGVTQRFSDVEHLRHREGFHLTDNGGTLKQALDDANYCIYCHKQEKDSCSTGLKEKPKSENEVPEYKINSMSNKLAGCPLEEKISEMNYLKAQASPLGALAVVAVDNPLCAATGHRICNDCMKSCIYQKQEPVNIPQTETRVLQDILELPWGFEIYGLFTRWNPLNIKRWLPEVDSGYKVLVVGLGPAGFNLSHHLLNEGHTVVAIDGLKIEPLPAEISGRTPLGERAPFAPIKNIDDIFDDLATRINGGFGGVAEYGITVRWNKNYLKVIRLLLERRAEFAMQGGVRFGGTITYDKAFELGFDHVALCLGAGRPTVISMPNGVARGVRTASDFLMGLQLTGAAKADSVANLQIRLPVAVIGGGLTAIDTATESLAYYPVQVEKFLSRYEILVRELGEKAVRARWSEEEREVAEEFISHAISIRDEREKASKENGKPEIVNLLNEWGGVRLVYRKKLQDSPSYRLNHEEVELAMQEGIGFVENASPVGVEIDKYGHAKALRVNYLRENEAGEKIAEERLIPAKTIVMAAGTNPNTVLHREDPEHFEVDGKYFSAVDEDGNKVTPEPSISKPKQPHVLMSQNDDGRFVSFFGDLHPSYVGNVVKAMGSAKQGYPVISRVLKKVEPQNKDSSEQFVNKMNTLLVAKVHDIVRLTPTILEVIIKAPLAAEAFEPGQFYRLQNFESLATRVGDGQEATTLAMEGLALTGAWVDKEKGLLSTIVLEMGGSSDLCAYLQKDEPVILMGPTGAATETPAGETVMLVGGGLGNAVLFSIGRAFKEQGSKVLYFAGYKQAIDRYKIEEIEAASDEIIWCCDEKEFSDIRDGDKSFHGNIVQAMVAFADGNLGDTKLKMQDVDRVIAIGSDRMMEAVSKARHTVLKPYLKANHKALGSINSPMQCMMKEICAQCLQKHVDPQTGEITYVYSCFNQDQDLDYVSFPHLNERLKQNGVQEKLTSLWIDRALKNLGLREKVA